MRRVRLLAGLTALTLGSSVTAARAAGTETPGGGQVTSLSVVPTLGHAEIVIAVGGPVEVDDFTLGSPARIVLDLRGAKLAMPAKLYDKVRRGSITNVRVAQYREDVVRVVIDLDGAHKYAVTRGETGIRVTMEGDAKEFVAWHATTEQATTTVATGTVAPATPAGPRQARIDGGRAATRMAKVSEPRITVTYQDADIRDVISAFAVFSSRTIVVGKKVEGTVSAEIRDQPWDVALRAILKAQGLDAREDPQDGIITVDSYENIAAQQATEPLSTQTIPVNYARAVGLVETVKGLLSKDCGVRGGASGGAQPAQPICTVRGSAAADTGTNRLIVTDVPSRLQDIVNFVKDLDVRTPQVSIKAKIIFVDRTNIEQLGVSYDLGSQGTFFNKLLQRPKAGTQIPIDRNGDGVPDGVGPDPLAQGYDRNAVVVGGNSLAAITNASQRVIDPALNLIFNVTLGQFSLTAFLDALQEVRLADLQAEPSIVTLDNHEASIVVGEETPIRIVDLGSLSQGGAQVQAPRATVNFKETGIILKVRPHITNNRQVLMTIHAERSNLQAAASDLGYTFGKQASDNQLLVGDGETAVVGGLTVTQVTQSRVGIPLLIDLPIIGRLFGTTQTQEQKRDLLILITPHIIDEGERIGPPDRNR